jgi:hypothetical protein
MEHPPGPKFMKLGCAARLSVISLSHKYLNTVLLKLWTLQCCHCCFLEMPARSIWLWYLSRKLNISRHPTTLSDQECHFQTSEFMHITLFQSSKLCNIFERGCLHVSPKSQGVTDQWVCNALTLSNILHGSTEKWWNWWLLSGEIAMFLWAQPGRVLMPPGWLMSTLLQVFLQINTGPFDFPVFLDQ